MYQYSLGVRDLETSRDKFKDKSINLEKEVGELTKSLKQVVLERNNKSSEIATLSAQVKQFDDSTGQLRSELKSLKEERREMNKTIADQKAKIASLEQQQKASMSEVVEQWKVTPEGIETIDDMARPIMVEGYWQAVHHLDQYTTDVSEEEKWDGLRCPRDDIGITATGQAYYLEDGPPEEEEIAATGDDEGEPADIMES
ncbi:hypothetical protein Dimus_038783 [Dionaea muscipula]